MYIFINMYLLIECTAKQKTGKSNYRNLLYFKTELLDTYNNLTSGFKTEEEINTVKPTSTK